MSEGFNVVIVQALWNRDITDRLVEDCVDALKRVGAKVEIYKVGGAVEIPVMIRCAIDNAKGEVSFVIGVGVILKGESDHNIYVARQVSYGCQRVALDTKVPVIFGVLTVDDRELAVKRAQGDNSHKPAGIEWVESGLQVANEIKRSGIVE